jgi:hypothetical protein
MKGIGWNVVFPAFSINIAFMALHSGNFVGSKKKTVKLVPLVISFCSQVMPHFPSEKFIIQ